MSPLRTDQVPVRKTLWDRLLFRSQAAVRRRLFGNPDAPTQPVSAETKATRLGDNAKTELKSALTKHQRGFFDKTRRLVHRRLLDGYVAHVRGGLEQVFVETQTRLEERLAQLVSDATAARRVVEFRVKPRHRTAEAGVRAVDVLEPAHIGTVLEKEAR